MNNGQNRVYFVLILLVLSSWWLADLFEEKVVKVVNVPDHSPDFYSVNYFKKEMTSEGMVANELKADKMTHYSDDGTTHLKSPVMTLFNSDKPPWVIESETGILEADKDNLFLGGDVFISREGRGKLKPFNLNTTELKVKLSTSYAETSEWAEIVDVPNRTEGVGMEMTFVEPIRVKFLSRVKGRYVFN